MKKLYVFTTDSKEQLEEWFEEDNCFLSLDEDDTLVVLAESIEKAIDEMKETEQIQDIQYYSVVLHDGTVFAIDREELDG